MAKYKNFTENFAERGRSLRVTVITTLGLEETLRSVTIQIWNLVTSHSFGLSIIGQVNIKQKIVAKDKLSKFGSSDSRKDKAFQLLKYICLSTSIKCLANQMISLIITLVKIS